MSYTMTDDYALVNGTCLQGHLVRTSYDRLVSILGEPNGPTDDRTRACWLLIFDDGTFASIYDYREEDRVEDVTWWSVGGRTKLALDHVQDIVPQTALDEPVSASEASDEVAPPPSTCGTTTAPSS